MGHAEGYVAEAVGWLARFSTDVRLGRPRKRGYQLEDLLDRMGR